MQTERPRVVSVPILTLQLGESPRLKGEDKAHIMRLAETEQPLPPIIVDRHTMRVIDGVHRLMAASLRGQATIDVEFFDGSPEDAFLLAVQSNVKHGLPLSQADRRAAALRILMTHPRMSDRAIAESTGLGTKAVAELRRSNDAVPQLNARIGKDGKVRPLSSREGRLRVAALLAEHPEASLRHIARVAGVSAATAMDVRKRLERGEEPVPPQQAAGGGGRWPKQAAAQETDWPGPPPGLALQKLLRDPSLRHNEKGRQLLRLLQENVSGASTMHDVVAAVPSHCLSLIMQVAWQNSEMWREVALELEKRSKVTDPFTKQKAGDAHERRLAQ
ncbi:MULTISPECIES: ParB N-terminal domain-containing protein [Nonomuraea]|uniref:ParB N-terminal domain-containing protein n=1 Tax=Nonomuraea TaxID=83681 RepID=UPI002FEA8E06